ncbi:AraC family transcriptional regulator [Oharaeibacter diazotrophicus]|uniref:AraC-like DNA-binding protein n=3 Tax=Oharaeibacter diazotrophicus TaxID=1920512 RepID=A0A4R6RM92_9HYPH|nr:AraC family transcriptional regulator [Oharaeibacter diazotrophicus]TDP87779.1 AraC-like DNA-binding protein [Oharaeibacter diazotrophicus]BBE74639.1 transcriptional regulator EutR [Pleomorphomonas sp. SM30]GLS77015.1 transcriptional regulator [Oharaeibacter diazotrophicus]
MTPTPDLPLARNAVVDTRRPDEAREAIGRIFCPHFLSPLERRAEGFHARHHAATFGDFSVNYVAYGATVEIDPGELARFYLLQIPLKGRARVRCGTRVAEAEAGRTASVLSPMLATRMTWQAGCEKLIVLVEREAMAARYGALADRPAAAPAFDTAVDLDGPVGMALQRQAAALLAAADAGARLPAAYLATLRDGVTTLMLAGLRHDRTDVLARPTAAPAPAAVRRAEAFIAENAGRAISTADVAAAAGVCLRSLQDAFRRARGHTITEALQAARLERLRAGLLDPDGPALVADIAFAAGFGHLGRAAAAYRERFGESPSETLRRRR